MSCLAVGSAGPWGTSMLAQGQERRPLESASQCSKPKGGLSGLQKPQGSPLMHYDFTPLGRLRRSTARVPLFRRRRHQNAVPSHFANDPLKFVAKNDIFREDGIIL
jgi:hypothetical protein